MRKSCLYAMQTQWKNKEVCSGSNGDSVLEAVYLFSDAQEMWFRIIE